MPRAEGTITIRVDADVLEWFRSQGKGDQTQTNATDQRRPADLYGCGDGTVKLLYCRSQVFFKEGNRNLRIVEQVL